MASPIVAESSAPQKLAETDVTRPKAEDDMVTDEQWRAIKKIIDNLYAYREQE